MTTSTKNSHTNRRSQSSNQRCPTYQFQHFCELSSHFRFTSISSLLFLLYHTLCQNYYIFTYFSLFNLFLQPINENIYNCAILWSASTVQLQGKFRKQSINKPHMFKSIIQFICLVQNCLNLTILSQPPAHPFSNMHPIFWDAFACYKRNMIFWQQICSRSRINIALCFSFIF